MSVASLERLVRPLLSTRGETVASNTESAHTSDSPPSSDRGRGVPEIAGTDQPGVLIVSDRPEAIGRIDALCQDLESSSPRIAIDLAIVSILPNSGRTLPWNQWRDSFGIIDSDLPAVLNQIRGMGRASVRASSQLQAMSGTWAELECIAQTTAHASDPGESAAAVNIGATTTTLHIRPSRQSDGAIRIEVRAQSSRLEDHVAAEHPQLVTVRFNTEVMLRDGATGVINLFVDQPLDAGSTQPGSNNRAVAALIAPDGVAIPATKILPQPGKREQTLLLLMPRIADATRPQGKVAATKSHNQS
jgi:type II secretory pathway component GspD/PulD (secretin)